jgi:hypothetical protein
MPIGAGSARERRGAQRFTATLECSRRSRAGRLDLEPRFGFGDELTHLGEQRGGRCLLTLKSVDPPQPLEHVLGFFHASDGSPENRAKTDRSVPKAIRSRGVAPGPARDFGEAREHIDRREWRAALRSLDRARKGYLKLQDRSGLEHVLQLLVVIDADDDDATRIERANLEYAAKQNLRFLTRTEAKREAKPWVDPYPDLESPSEHTGIHLSRTVKIWIGVGVVLGILALAGYITLVVLYGTPSSQR